MIHISAPYYADADYVFVLDRKLGPHCIPARDYKRLGRALGATLVTCSYCDEPAIRIDHSYPYRIDITMCAEHLAMPRGGWRQVGRLGYWHWFRGYRSLCGNWERAVLTFGDEVPTGKVCVVCARKQAGKNTEVTG